MLVKVPVILCQQTELGLHQELITLQIQIQMSTITMAIRLDSNQPEEHNQTTTQRPSPHLSGLFNEGNVPSQNVLNYELKIPGFVPFGSV